MLKYLAHPTLCVTENLGSQMWHFAAMTAIARRTGHRVQFFEEHIGVGKGLQLHRHFDNLPMEVSPIEALPEVERMHWVFPIDRRVVVDSGVFRLDPARNYAFDGLFISYKYWYPIRSAVASMYSFRPDVLACADAAVEPARRTGRPVVSVHVRRTDYLNGVFVNAAPAYYQAAMAMFDGLTPVFMVFSDDLAWCHATFGGREDVMFVETCNPPIVDMAAMSRCDHHIIANSSFGFWGAFLNSRPGRQIVCPARTMKVDHTIPHVNYAWYPDEFLGLDVGND